ncbi:hypothetical protein [Streptomyces sp. NBC_00038]|uniref:hypothetical protein n=1 Tax=Streptomyces sp. NBC_00038 TaxID=2903615 RepID=UPI00225074A5|nr:hypothetical protein [Streptomyces sp. NBC_00038]MCX5562749.1 hypothetical protein [Streptomyces sp. NBC_00038]MCX5563601.1 hypothetical protein [Streptomyces sp. NBC_00038]
MTEDRQPLTAVEALAAFAGRHTDPAAVQALIAEATRELTGRTVVWPEDNVTPLRLYFRRHEDVSGVSGEGRIADGVQWPDGSLSIRWRGPHPKIDFCDRGVDTAEFVHGHDGLTELVFIDQPGETPAPAPAAAGSAAAPLVVRRVLEHALKKPVPCPKCSRTAQCRCIADRTEGRIDAVLGALAPWLNSGTGGAE